MDDHGISPRLAASIHVAGESIHSLRHPHGVTPNLMDNDGPCITLQIGAGLGQGPGGGDSSRGFISLFFIPCFSAPVLSVGVRPAKCRVVSAQR